ncbi:Cytochrome p450 [Thalictrum thalictroides]|uniref:Cytochrome p450 n=1 Tax=Thalictrum thalictroides TaxID=46969 RepID=A0A7J6VDK4_THATH|nr:Cytochrome p450 [Thalictrum thalictroides]
MHLHETLFAYHLFTRLSLIFIFSTLILLLLLVNRRSWGAEKLNLPPSPPKLPIVGNLHQIGLQLHRSIHNLSEKYGPLMFLRLGYLPTLVVSSAEMAKEIKVTHDIAFANRPQTTAVKLSLYGCVDVAFCPYGEYWAQVRKISVIELLSTKKVQSFKSVREEEIALMLKKISQSSSMGAPVNVSELATALTNDIVCRCALGRKHGNSNFGDLAGKLLKLQTAITFSDLFPWLGWMDNLTGLMGRIKNISRELDIFYDQVIDEHLIHENKHDNPDYNKDFIDILLQIQKHHTNFSRENIKAIIMDMFIGGTESTSTTIEWAFAELVKNQNVMRKAQEEVRRVVGKKNKVDEEDIHQMQYLKLVIKESMRLHPAVAINVLESSMITNIRGFHVPANTRLVINNWSIQRDPKQWERPDEFIPERFSYNPVDFKGKDYKFIPFGAGRRICPGISFAMIVVESAVANLLYWFDWKTLDSEELDMTEGFRVTVTMKTVPLRLIAVPHLS